jgi:transcriptional regulator with XRE-family HTH domain
MATVFDPTVAQRFAQNMVALRKKAGLSQEELGFLASLHRTEIGMLERGARLARADTILKLAGALGAEPNDLFAGMAWRPLRLASTGGFEAQSKEAGS